MALWFFDLPICGSKSAVEARGKADPPWLPLRREFCFGLSFGGSGFRRWGGFVPSL